MAGFAEEMTFEGLGRWCDQMGRNLAGAALHIPLERAAVAIKADLIENFRSQHAPDGTPWAPLAHPRVHSAGNDQPLRDTARLEASVAAQGEGHIETITDVYLEIGSNLEYAALQNYGGTIEPKNVTFLAIPLTVKAKRAGTASRYPDKLHAVIAGATGVLVDDQDVAQYALTKGPITIPARPFIGFSPKLIDTIEKIFAEYLAQLTA